jgi:lysophospholipase
MALDRRTVPARIRMGEWRAPDGWRMRRFDWTNADSPRGSILFQAGRGDFIEKYLEAQAHWHLAGWNVSGFDWRGQGGSGRLHEDPLIGHADSLDPFLDDFDAFYRDWREHTPGPHVLIGHSMGGHMTLRLLAERRPDVSAAILVAPMLGLNADPIPAPIARAITRLACRLGLARRAAWKQGERPVTIGLSRQSNLTSSIERYEDEAWWKANQPGLALGAPSWGWLRAAYDSVAALDRHGALEAVMTPLLLIGAERDRLVSPRAIKRAARRLPQAELIMSGVGAHELLREVDEIRLPLLASIDRFLDAKAPVR